MNNSHTALYTNEQPQMEKATIYSRIRHRIYDPISKIFFQLTVGLTKLRIQKRDYEYLVHWYNYTWTNERAIEIPYFSHLISQYSAQKILEVGNTLAHYQAVKHKVIDKYETAPHVENLDVLEFTARGKFDLIFAISTLEHVGWHEKEKRAEKALEAISHLKGLLSPKGRLVFSFPLGVNPALDSMIKKSSQVRAKLLFLRRKNSFNSWEEATYNEVKAVKYNAPYPNANAICIATFTREG